MKVAIKDRDKYKLQYSINEFKTEKVEDVDMDLEKAERLLKEITSRDSMLYNLRVYTKDLGTIKQICNSNFILWSFSHVYNNKKS